MDKLELQFANRISMLLKRIYDIDLMGFQEPWQDRRGIEVIYIFSLENDEFKVIFTLSSGNRINATLHFKNTDGILMSDNLENSIERLFVRENISVIRNKIERVAEIVFSNQEIEDLDSLELLVRLD